MAPPLKNLDEKEVARLAYEGASNREIGYILGCDDKTVASRFSALLDKKRAERRVAMRSAQNREALGGNTTLLIWIGKQELDQRDVPAREKSDDVPQDDDELWGAVEELQRRRNAHK